jgi:hypothetical protein
MIKKPAKKPSKKAATVTKKIAKKINKPIPLAKLIAKLDKDQGPPPSLYETAAKLDEVINTLVDIRHLMDSALDDCLNLNDDARAMALLHIAYGMVGSVIEKADPLASDLYRINRANLK